MTEAPLPSGEVAGAQASSIPQALAEKGEGPEPPTLSPEDHAAALAQERDAIRLDRETFGMIWPLALIPLGLVILFLSALLGERAWLLWPAGFLAIVAMLRMIPLRARYLSELPLELPEAIRLHGERKRRFLVKAALIGGALFVAGEMFRMFGGRLWEWRVPWPW